MQRAGNCDELIANDRRSIPSRRPYEPNDLLPTQRPALVAPPNCQVPTHNRLRSTANNHVSRHTPAPGAPFAFRPERRAESWSPPPPGLGQLLSLLAWLSSWSPSLVPRRSRRRKTGPAPMHKRLFSYKPPRHGFVSHPPLGFVQISDSDFSLHVIDGEKEIPIR